MAVRWKVCGVRDAATATLAVDCGADAIGFVFYPPSPRAVSPAAAARISAALPRDTWRVGVFVDADRAVIEATVREVGLDFVQLSGDEPASAAAGLSRHVFKALRLDATMDGDAAQRFADRYADCSLLVDAAVDGEYGGTGRPANWAAATALARRHRLMLAGGLTAANIGAALDRVRPWAIDVSSGLEESPGCKSPDRIREFAAALESHR